MSRGFLVVTILLAGCHRVEPFPGGFAQGSPRAPVGEGKAYFQLSPADLTTAADSAQLAAWAEFPGPVPVALLSEVATKLSLVTWPEGVPIAWTASIRIAPSGYDPDPFSKVIVQPTQPLSSRWYALKAAPLEGRLAMRQMTQGMDSLQQGETMVRFRYGSEPRVVAIDESYNKEDPRYPIFSKFPYLVQVLLSETVPTADAVTGFSLTGPGTTGCAPAPAQGEITTRVAFQCQSSVIGNLGVVVGSFASRAGAAPVASSGIDGSSIQVDPTRIVVLPDQIRRFHIEMR